MPETSALKKEAIEELSTADKVKATIQSITNKIDSVASTLPFFRSSEMGVLWLAPIPLGIIVGGISLLTMQIVSLRKLDERLDHEKFLIEKGADPATIIAGRETSKPWLDLGLGQPFIWILVIGAGYLLWQANKGKLLK